MDVQLRGDIELLVQELNPLPEAPLNLLLLEVLLASRRLLLVHRKGRSHRSLLEVAQLGLVNDVVAKKMIEQAIRIYNEKRLHLSLDLNTPQFAHNQYNEIKYKSYKKSA